MRKLVLFAALGLFACGGSNSNNSGGAVCGDGKIADAEGCDDGNAVSGDGCSATCQPEPGFTCTTPGKPCTSTAVCGDGVRTGGEQCDLGRDLNGTGKGCSATCTQDDGWTCPSNEARCTAICGDGKIISGVEGCDLGPNNNGPGKGCNANCQIDPGWVCDTSTGVYACHQTVCGDNHKEGAEECDDGNLVPFDGCSPTCTKEPTCKDGTCTAVCGDGLVFAPEQCDDGNTKNGDGCDSNCNLEPEDVTGFHCETKNQPPPTTLVIPILYHDMRYNADGAPHGSPDFELLNPGVVCKQLVQPKLSPVDGKPVWNSDFGVLINGAPNTSQALNGTGNFDCWWRDKCLGGDNAMARNVWLDVNGRPTTLALNQLTPGANVYQMDNQAFFPVDGLGWNAPGSGLPPEVSPGRENPPVDHNFSFTSELHYPFTYDASTSPKFDFTGDDDVWVFINGNLAVDLGGVHGASNGSVTLDPTTAGNLGLKDKGMYSIDMFQAERHTSQSTYKLTLSGFVHALTTCGPICGDGKVVGNEACDDGPKNGMAGFCNTTCTARIPKCGNGIVEPGEECDNGVNDGTYGTCAPGCKLAAYCGDTKVNGGEQCDNGSQNVGLDVYDKDGVGLCTVACTAAPKCGDGIIETEFGEQCEGGLGCFDCRYPVTQ